MGFDAAPLIIGSLLPPNPCELRTKVRMGGTYKGMYREVRGGPLRNYIRPVFQGHVGILRCVSKFVLQFENCKWLQ